MENTPAQQPSISSIPTDDPTKELPPPLVKKRGFLFSLMLFLIGVSIIIVSILIGMFVYEQTHPKQTNPLEDLISASNPDTNENHFPEGYVSQPPEATTTDKTTNQTPWRLYNNETYNFSLSFPAHLIPSESSYGMGVSTVELRSQDNQNSEYAPDIQFLIFPKTLGKLIGQDFETYHAMAYNASTIIEDTQGASQTFTKLRNKTISGLRAVDFSTVSAPPVPNEVPTVGTYIEIGNSVFILSTNEGNKSLMESILETFTYPL